MALSTLYLTVLLLSLASRALTEVPPSGLCSAGVPGSPGHNGEPGRDGRDGKDGRDGASGAKGDCGEPGKAIQGPPGEMGPAGSPGPKGEKGDVGERGTKGCGHLHACISASLYLVDFENSSYAFFIFFLFYWDAKNNYLFTAASFRIFRKVGLKYYATDGMKDTFDAGLKFCRDAGGDLVLPKSETENEVLVHMLTSDIQVGWIRATDRKTEGIFLDTDDSELTFTKWKLGEPNNYKGREDCVMLSKHSEWNDCPCDGKSLVVCEIMN
ncbi:hypothetical protein ACEWY4_024129 [Coilia grayii]|uniref:C-type lectin domain-containing protein n=1 Tax=Coilia grayii TaxID=363190 RepID=A0ABD1IZG3_9TELE